jgi:hypothetical protein
MEIDKKKPKSVVGIIPSDSAMGSTLLKKNVGPTSMTRGVFAVVDKLIKENPALADEFLKQVQWHEDHTKRVGRKAEFESDDAKEQANNMLEIFRTWSRTNLSAFKSLVSNDEDFKACTITRIEK